MIVDLGGKTYTVPPFCLMPNIPVDIGRESQAHLAVGLSCPEFSEFKAIHLRQVNNSLRLWLSKTHTPRPNRAARRRRMKK